jgi:hypothetical protein
VSFNLSTYSMNPDELIFHTVGNELISAGFGINSILLKRGLAPILSFATNDESSSSSDNDSSSSDEEEDKSVFRSFKNLAVPFGLMTSDKYTQHPHNEDVEDRGVLPDTLYDNLLKLVDMTPSIQKIKKRSAKRKIHKRSNNKSARKRNKE